MMPEPRVVGSILTLSPRVSRCRLPSGVGMHLVHEYCVQVLLDPFGPALMMTGLSAQRRVDVAHRHYLEKNRHPFRRKLPSRRNGDAGSPTQLPTRDKSAGANVASAVVQLATGPRSLSPGSMLSGSTNSRVGRPLLPCGFWTKRLRLLPRARIVTLPSWYLWRG